MRSLLAGVVLVLGCSVADAADEKPRLAPRDALQPFNQLIGSWKGTGLPEGSREAKQKGFWTETVRWGWQFKGDDCWLTVTFDEGKHFARGELRYLPEADQFQLRLVTADKKALTYAGPFKDQRLTLEREDAETKETQRLVVSLIHDNRFLYRYEVKPADRPLFAKRYEVGATKEGVEFAGSGNTGPECVVSGGLGTIKVMYKGEAYYVCCSGCRDAFNDDPEKWLKEYAARKAKEKAKKP